MWITDFLRKLTKGPKVGETFRDYIGCYLYGTEVTASNRPEYVGAPATLEELEKQVRLYLEDFIATQKDQDTPDGRIVLDLLAHLPQRLHQHVQTDMTQALANLNGVDFFVRSGVRERRKVDGKFVE